MAAAGGGRPFGEGPLARATGVVHWLLVVEVAFVVTTAPGLVPALLLDPVASNLPLYAVCAVPLAPAVAAAVHAWRTFLADRDAEPLRCFARGYRLGLVDSLRVAVPALLVLAVVAVAVAHRAAVPGGAVLWPLQVVVGVVVALVAVRATCLGAVLSFRWRDLLRLSVLTLVTRPSATLGLLSLGVLVAGTTYLTFDAVVVLLASPLTLLLARGEAPVVADVRERFVEPAAP